MRYIIRCSTISRSLPMIACRCSPVVGAATKKTNTAWAMCERFREAWHYEPVRSGATTPHLGLLIVGLISFYLRSLLAAHPRPPSHSWFSRDPLVGPGRAAASTHLRVTISRSLLLYL